MQELFFHRRKIIPCISLSEKLTINNMKKIFILRMSAFWPGFKNMNGHKSFALGKNSKLYAMLLSVLILLASCAPIEPNVTTESIRGTVWVNAYHSSIDLTDVSIITFYSDNVCDIFYVGTTRERGIQKYNYIIINNSSIILTPKENTILTFECIVKKDELLMYNRTPDIDLGKEPSKFKRVY
jgi:hypothetical protein